ncbi:OsmC family protein [Phenylobacterium sp.]|uniref:OsmC family protein n=1 Tax=Phenylobacterium sp. TaxID=1871053 RepID=UPI0035B46801
MSHQRIATVSENRKGPFGQTVHVGANVVQADEPVELGGLGQGLDPFEFVLAGLGACTSMTIRMYATRKGWPLDHVEVVTAHAERLSEGAPQDVFTREIRLHGDLSDEERARLLDIAERCPVSRSLGKGAIIRSHLAEAGEGVGGVTS